MKKFCFSLLLVFPILVFGQLRNADVYKLPEMGKENIRENINIPGFDGYEVLKCDFHIHTVFSDGRVWRDRWRVLRIKRNSKGSGSGSSCC